MLIIVVKNWVDGLVLGKALDVKLVWWSKKRCANNLAMNLNQDIKTFLM